MASTAEGHRNITMGEQDWSLTGALALPMASRSVAIRMAVRFAASQREAFLRFVLTQPDLKPNARRSIESSLTPTKEN